MTARPQVYAIDAIEPGTYWYSPPHGIERMAYTRQHPVWTQIDPNSPVQILRMPVSEGEAAAARAVESHWDAWSIWAAEFGPDATPSERAAVDDALDRVLEFAEATAQRILHGDRPPQIRNSINGWADTWHAFVAGVPAAQPRLDDSGLGRALHRGTTALEDLAKKFGGGFGLGLLLAFALVVWGRKR